MQTASFCLDLHDEQTPHLPFAPSEVDLLLVFGERSNLEDPYLPGKLQLWFPAAEIAGGQAAAPGAGKGCLQGHAFRFDKAQVESIYRSLPSCDEAWKAGWETGRQLDADDLKVVLLFGAGSADAYRAYEEGMLEAFGPYPPLLCSGLPGNHPVPGDVVLSSKGLFRRGMLALGIFGNRIEVAHSGLGAGALTFPRLACGGCRGSKSSGSLAWTEAAA